MKSVIGTETLEGVMQQHVAAAQSGEQVAAQAFNRSGMLGVNAEYLSSGPVDEIVHGHQAVQDSPVPAPCIDHPPSARTDSSR